MHGSMLGVAQGSLTGYLCIKHVRRQIFKQLLFILKDVINLIASLIWVQNIRQARDLISKNRWY
jgi:hypothetical protein